MRRRDLLALLGGTAVLRPVAGRAQQAAMPVVGMLMIGTTEARGKQLEGFRQGLAEAGYSDGKNVAVEPRWAESDIARLPILAADLVARRVTVIAAMSGPSALPRLLSRPLRHPPRQRRPQSRLSSITASIRSSSTLLPASPIPAAT